MAIIKIKDFIESDLILKALQSINTEIDKSIKLQKELQTATRNISKEGSGAEAKKRVEMAQKLNGAVSETTRLQKERIKVDEQLKTTFAKLLTAQEKNNQVLAKGKIQLQERNKLIKQQARNELGLVGAYEKESRKLTELRKKYKDLIVVQGKETSQTKALRNEITKLDSKLKAVDNSVGQNQRSVGKYTDALKGLGGQLLGAAGITVGISSLVSGLQAFTQRAGTLIKVTNQIKGTFNVTNEEAKKLSSTVFALAKNFDEDYNQILISANSVSKEFGISADESLRLIEQGFKKGSNNSGEFLDILREYPVQLKSIGLNAEESFAIINQQVKAGVYSDKGIDALKEAGLRLRENTKAVKAALSVFDADTRAQIENAVARGEVFEATQLISKGIKENGLNAQQTQAIIADVFGGAGEDAQSFVLALDDVNLSLDGVANQTSIVKDANIELSKSWNDFVGEVAEGSGFISKAWAGIQSAATNLLQILTRISQGQAAISDAQKKEAGFYEKLNSEYQKYSDILNKVTDATERQNKAQKLAQTARANQIIAQNKVNQLIKDGASASDIMVIRMQVQADLYGEISKKLTNDYIPAKVIENQKDDESVKIKTNLTTATKGQTEAQKALNKEIAFTNAQLKQQDGLDVDPGEIPLPDDTSDLDAVKKLVESLDYEEQLRLEKEKQIQDGLKEIRETAISEATQFASDVFAQDQDNKLARIESDIEAEKKIAEQQLADGEINQIQYNQKIGELNKKFRIEEGRAEKKKALFDIAIQTAVAIVKALPNLVAAGIAAVTGAIQAGIVAAKPIPGFKTGVIGFQGAGTETSDSNLVKISKNESVITAQGTGNAPLALDAINKGLVSDAQLGFNAQLYKPEASNNAAMLSKLDSLNATQNQMLTALLNGASEFTEGDYKVTRFADGRSHYTKINK